MSARRMPALFLSHGSPMTALHDSAARHFLETYAAQLPRPTAILIASAHFESRLPFVTADARPATIHDFGGFPQALFDIRYPAPGSPDLAVRAAGILQTAGFEALPVANRGFDHGTWVPLKLMYPDADVPVVQISVQTQMSAAHHVSLGQALRSLRDEGVLIVGSGSLTHNLYELSRRRGDLGAPALDWVSEFAEWIAEKVEAGDADAIADYRTRAPFARQNHSSEEHFLPLPFAMGAGGGAGKRIHSSYNYGLLSMDAYRFD